jgi:5-methyltetrahydrofolate--homocysteine methyltransferase
MAERAYTLARQKLEHMAPLEVIDAELVPALDRVGADYEIGKLFLPQLLMSAQAAQSAFRAVSERMQLEGGVQQKRGKVIVATVKGDIHDIGKNIVRVLLENYGFEVIDLGKDVPAETVVAAAREQDVHLVGLSALMTTTVRSMQETIEALHLSDMNAGSLSAAPY